MHPPTSKRRLCSGASLAEATAAIALLLPVLVMIIMVAVEAGYGYIIKINMDGAARRAARDLAIAYGQDPSIAQDSSKVNTVLSMIRIANMVVDNAQFGEPVFQTDNPPTATVTVTYASGQYGLAPFPNPDPLNLGPTFTISSTATYHLE